MQDYNIEVIRRHYQMVPRTLIFIEKGERLLMLSKNKSTSFGYGKINGVGGHMEQGEEPFESARREIMEETGLQVDRLDLAAILFIDIHDVPGIQVFVFKGEYASGKELDSEEGHLEWMTRAEIDAYDKKVKDLPFLIEVIDKYQTGKPPAMIKYLYDEDGEVHIVG
ncbi:MAG: 8-oxo-dGTP diphosphatase [Chloroflexota bacterium]|nr:8-oxo-dGTP diphosphatase [Chloroflexota bacterium]